MMGALIRTSKFHILLAKSLTLNYSLHAIRHSPFAIRAIRRWVVING